MEFLIVGTAIASAAMGGVFFVFSTFVMAGLKRLPPAQGIAAMQSINITAVTPPFMTLLFGTAAACVAVAVNAVIEWRSSVSSYLVVGSLCYLIGCVGVTVVFNVPLNNALAKANPSSSDTLLLWTTYVRTWTAWNHVRTVTGLVAAALLLMALASTQ